MHALLGGWANCLELLVARGYGLEPASVHRELFKASRAGDAEVIQRLLDVAGTVFPRLAAIAEDGTEALAQPEAETLLMAAVRSGSVETVGVVLSRGAPLYPRLGAPGEPPAF